MNAFPDSIDSHKINLSAQLLGAGHPITLQVLGLSMLPTLWPGDRITVERQEDNSLMPGDIVLCQINNRFVMHRLITKSSVAGGATVITIRGDCLARPDHKIEASNVQGRITTIHRNGRTIPARNTLSSLKRAVGLLLCYCPPIRGVVLRLRKS